MAQPTKGALHAMPSYASRRGGSHNVTPPSLAFAFLAVLSILFAGAAFAQTGTVTGKVTDNAQGIFTIIKVPVGVYTVRVSMLGFAKVERPGVRVDANKTTTLEFKLTEEVVKMREVEVTGDLKIAIRKKDSSTKQIVTAQD